MFQPSLAMHGLKGVMTKWQGVGLLVTLYLGLLARSAWKQGEIRQFLMSCLVLAALIAVLAAIVSLTIFLDRR